MDCIVDKIRSRPLLNGRSGAEVARMEGWSHSCRFGLGRLAFFVYLVHRWLLVLPTAMASDHVLFTSLCIFSHVIAASWVDKIVLCIQYSAYRVLTMLNKRGMYFKDYN
jgi:hypothetical protein